jgi:GNAT superfamily N-acetyltransferase
MLRPPGPVAAPRVEGLSVRAVATADEVRLFERTIFGAADGNPDWAPAGSVHPAEETLRVAGLTLFLAWLDGEPVGTALAAVDSRVVQVSAVSVQERARRRGVASALTAACIGVAPELPAVLDSTDLGHGVYLRLGFGDVGESVLWERASR